ncbi:hypothetical protein EHRUM4_05470 [Ehrlichia ruminantium]|uniref:Uncharacterized protein n=1 Tax=Ehrlichia ruminantium TaxID=779 RepID=A0A170RWN2_EHRRU|nr:hypothetical protein [Ehrlichia ruminantium]GAT75330.1 hypothetical protein EHRUM4_05470 [Ehrlichia ruminantium]GAT77322.1 hypothetical protein EHRUM2_05420 [Ehrlichia ruminantium]GAT78431.1 hypothetical protein EHRUM3_06540 [Ehrlichia ruminantium]
MIRLASFIQLELALTIISVLLALLIISLIIASIVVWCTSVRNKGDKTQQQQQHCCSNPELSGRLQQSMISLLNAISNRLDNMYPIHNSQEPKSDVATSSKELPSSSLNETSCCNNTPNVDEKSFV